MFIVMYLTLKQFWMPLVSVQKHSCNLMYAFLLAEKDGNLVIEHNLNSKEVAFEVH